MIIFFQGGDLIGDGFGLAARRVVADPGAPGPGVVPEGKSTEASDKFGVMGFNANSEVSHDEFYMFRLASSYVRVVLRPNPSSKPAYSPPLLTSRPTLEQIVDLFHRTF